VRDQARKQAQRRVSEHGVTFDVTQRRALQHLLGLRGKVLALVREVCAV